MGTERTRELRRRRHRKKKVALLVKRASTANNSAKVAIAEKLRKLTPGAELIIAAHGIER